MSAIAIAQLVAQALRFVIENKEDIGKAVELGKPIIQALTRSAPAALPVLGQLASKLFPHLNEAAALQALTTAAFTPEKMSRTEEELWFQRASGANTG